MTLCVQLPLIASVDFVKTNCISEFALYVKGDIEKEIRVQIDVSGVMVLPILGFRCGRNLMRLAPHN